MTSGMLWAKPQSVLVSLLLYYAILVPYVKYRLEWTPSPIPADAPGGDFSESRALAHVAHLTKVIGDRQISSPGLAVARDYVLEKLRGIQATAAPNLVVEVAEQRATGAISMVFTGQNFTNAYRGLSNVMLALRPKGVDPDTPALLIASHYDSAVCSVGAADDASQVGVMLEAARVLATSQLILAAPVIFLFTGGEESISQAAHGFVKSHPWWKRAGAFINLEAMGGGGLPIVFQHTGAWTLEAYAAGARHPRGTRVAQDVFDTGIIPGDSDYRMFSALHYGSLPGIDIAIIRDSAAYHTYLDRVERIRPGVLQEVGDNLMGAMQTFTNRLAGSPPLGDAAGAARVQADPGSPPQLLERAVYFDVLGLCMFSYRDKTARALHNAPLLLLAALPLLARTQHQSTGSVAVQLLTGASRQLCTILLAVGLPAAFGALRVFVTGVPMIWFSHHWIGFAIYLPVAAAGALSPWLGLHSELMAKPGMQQGHHMRNQVHGCGLAAALLAAAANVFDLQGSAFIFALSAYLALALGFLLDAVPLRPIRLFTALAAAVVPILSLGAIVGTFVAVMMERMALTGHQSQLLADMAIGALTGSSVLALTVGCLVPLLAFALAPYRKQVITILLLAAVGVSAYAHMSLQPYSEHYPKRVLVTHMFQTRPLDTPSLLPPDHSAATSDTAACSAQASAPARPPATRPEMQVTSSALVVGITDSTPLSHMLDAKTLASQVAENGREDVPMYPLDRMLNGVHAVLPAPASRQAPLVKQLPSLSLSSSEVGCGGERKLHLELFSELPCWGVLNITGPVLGWSFGDTPIASRTLSGGGLQYVVRFTTEHPNPVWPFWLTVPASAEDALAAGGTDAAATADRARAAAWAGTPALVGLRLELTVSYLQQTDVLKDAVAKLPSWVTPSWAATAYQSVWEL